jgi:protein phosphatase
MNEENKGPAEIRSTRALDFGLAQSQGVMRGENQDAMLALCWHFLDGAGEHNLGLFAVADGVGGAPNGQLASRLAIRRLGQSVSQDLLEGDDKSPFRAAASLRKGFLAAHKAVMDRAQGGGTTLTAVLIEGGTLHLAHVGDSRAYRFEHGGGMVQLSEDDSLIRWMGADRYTTKGTRNPLRNVLTQAVGQAQGIRPQFLRTDWSTAFALLLCTDGMWKSLGAEEAEEIVRSGKEPTVVCRLLVNLVNERGGPDNISAMLVKRE